MTRLGALTVVPHGSNSGIIQEPSLGVLRHPNRSTVACFRMAAWFSYLWARTAWPNGRHISKTFPGGRGKVTPFLSNDKIHAVGLVKCPPNLQPPTKWPSHHNTGSKKAVVKGPPADSRCSPMGCLDSLRTLQPLAGGWPQRGGRGDPGGPARYCECGCIVRREDPGGAGPQNGCSPNMASPHCLRGEGAGEGLTTIASPGWVRKHQQ